MTTQEFEVQFDVLYNNITSNQAPGLNAYEKSVFLTKAQEQLIHEYFNTRTDGVGQGFDGSPKRQLDFENIIITEHLQHINSPVGYNRIHPNSFIFKISVGGDGLRRKHLYIINEFIFATRTVGTETEFISMSVKPLSYEEFQRVMLKPYKYPPKGIAWRVMNNSEFVEIINLQLINANSIDYYIRYLRKPAPIILEPRLDLLMVTIDGIGFEDGNTYTWAPNNPTGTSTITECELPEEVHQEILERAVTLAKIAWQGNTATQEVMAAQSKSN